jgi:hypothetical protein
MDFISAEFLTTAQSVLQIPAVHTQAHDGSRPGKLTATPSTSRTQSSRSSSGSSSGSSDCECLRTVAAARQHGLRQPVAAVARPPAKPCRIVWDRQIQLRVFWLTVFFCVVGEQIRSTGLTVSAQIDQPVVG